MEVKVTKQIQVELDGQNYIWDGRKWYGAKSYEEPPAIIAQKLNSLSKKSFSEEDSEIHDLSKLVKLAAAAREAQQFERAEKLVRRVLKIEPYNEAAMAVLCAVLRGRGLPKQALAETEQFRKTDHVPLLTSRAAALCDLKRWEEAKRVIAKAHAIRADEETFAVINRIKSKKPELYKPK